MSHIFCSSLAACVGNRRQGVHHTGLLRSRGVLAFALLTVSVAPLCAPHPATAQLVSQNFETWPDTGTNWGTYAQEGWTIMDSQTRPTRGGHGITIGGRSAWLNDFDATSNVWIRSPLMPHGVDLVRFQMRRNEDSVGDQLFSIDTSTNGTNWVTQAIFDRVDGDWSEASHLVATSGAVYVRINKTGDFTTNAYLGIDNIELIPPPGVLVSSLLHTPASPTAQTPVHVFINAEIASDSSNVLLRAWYRFGVAGAFTSLSMSNITNTTYRTSTPIPSGYTGTVQYFVECTYDGFGVSPLFSPSAGSNSPAFYDTSNPYLSTALRQLTPSSHRTPLIISEIMYHPANAATTNSLAFVEIFNTEPVSQNLGGFRLSGDVAYTFPPDTILRARSFAVVAAEPAAAEPHYGISGAFGPMTGGLPNSGGTVRLRNRDRAILLEVKYRNQLPWPIEADGAGHSLVLTLPDYGENSPLAWRPSRLIGGSPGDADPATTAPEDAVVLNEFLTHTDLPDLDYIELFNTGTQAVNLTGCTLSDSLDTNKFTLPPGSIIAPLGFLVFTQTDLGFSLSSHGDEIAFGSADQSRLIDAVRFPAQINGTAMGRFPDGTAPRVAPLATLGAKTPGTSNNPAGLRPEAIVINEVMYHPLSGDSNDEYVELLNTSTSAVDVGNWRFVDGIDFSIPPGTTIPAGSYLVVARNAAHLRSRYPQLNADNTVGDFAGQLADRGERLALARPDNPFLPDVDFVPVDELTYADGDDWGRWADGGGSSLELIDPRSDNRRPMNWAGSDESAKAPWTTVNVTGTIDNGTLVPNELRVVCLGPAESLLDNVLVKAPSGSTYLDANFEGGMGAWSPVGNHVRTTLETTEGDLSSKSLHLRATDGGAEGTWSGWSEAFWNRVSTPLLGTPPGGSVITIQARARWLAGFPYVVLALRGYWMEASVLLDVPKNLGSPGLANSRTRPNTGPAIDAVTHTPILPTDFQPTVVSCNIADPDGLAAVTLRYRLDPDTNYIAVTMNDGGTGGDLRAGDGRYSGTIPGQGTGARAAFFVQAVDAAPAPQTNAFPIPPRTGAPIDECILRFGQTLPAGVLGNYLLWMSDASINLYSSIAGGKYSNEPIGFTFVYGNDRAFYAAGSRYRGLWRRYNSPVSSGAYSIELPKSDRFLGLPDFDLDQIGQNGADNTRQAEGYCFWLARQVGIPAPYVRYSRVNVNGTDRGILHDLQTTGSDFCESWYEDPDPGIFKLSGWVGDPFVPYVDGFGNYKQSRYRWLMDKRIMLAPNDDFTPIYHVVAAAATVSNEVYESRMRALFDIRRFTGFFAVNGATAAWDHYGWSYTHNGLLYVPTDRGAAAHIYDMDGVLSGARALFPSAAWPVPYRMFNLPAFRRVYLALLKELAEGPMTASQTNPRMDDLYNAFLANTVAVSAPNDYKTWIAGYRPVIQAAYTPYTTTFAITTGGGTNLTTTNTIATLNGTAPIEVDAIRINGIRNAVSYPTITNWSLRVGLPQGTNTLLLTAHDWRGNQLASNSFTINVIAPAPSPLGQVIISEIMYHPAVPNAAYVEFYNRSATHTFDLRGWRLNGADGSFEGGAILGPQQFGVIAENLFAYQHTYSNAEAVLGTFSGTLDNGGETLSLQMPAGTDTWTTVNAVTYDDDPPWSPEANGDGQALQVIDLNQDNTRPGNWGVISTAVPLAWKFKVVSGIVSNAHPSVLANTVFGIYLHGPGTAYVDRVSLVTGTVAETGMNLLSNGMFDAALAPHWSPMGNHTNSSTSTNLVHSGTASLAIVSTGFGSFGSATNGIAQTRPLSGLGNKPVILSYWYFEDPALSEISVNMGNTSAGATHSLATPGPLTAPIATPGATNTVAATLPVLPNLWINEVMPSNVMSWADNFGEFDPWIEIYNAGTSAVDLTDCRLSNTYADPGRWAFPTGQVLAAGARLLIWADASTNQTAGPDIHANIALNNVTGSVILALSYFGEHLVLDSLNYDAIGADFSYGSYPEGDPRARQVFHTPTPGSANTPLSLPQVVVINEWMADNETTTRDPSDLAYDDWFELFNPSAVPVNLGGYFLTDNLSQPNKFTIPGGFVLPPHGFLRVWADSDDAINGPGQDLHGNFKLNNGGEAIGLFRPDNSLMDAVLFGPMDADQSQGCWPDGVAAIYPMIPPTPGTTNCVLLVTSLPPAGTGGFTLDWLATSGEIYRVDGSTDLITTNWLTLGIVTANSSAINFTDTNSPAYTNRFYRILQAP